MFMLGTPEFTIATYSSRLGMANRMIASRGQPELDSRRHTAISDRNSHSCAIAYPRNGAAKSETQLGLSKFELRRISNIGPTVTKAGSLTPLAHRIDEYGQA